MSSDNESSILSLTSENSSEGQQPEQKTTESSYKYSFERVFGFVVSTSLNWHSSCQDDVMQLLLDGALTVEELSQLVTEIKLMIRKDSVRSRSGAGRGRSAWKMKRDCYISWSDYFMGIASLAALRSKDPRRQVGACIISEDNKIVGVGYNGMPGGNDNDFPWERNCNFLECKLTYVCHAEMNAFMNAVPKDTKNCYLYVTLFPCNECAKIIIQAKIKEVIYKDDKYDLSTKAAKRMFDKMNIKYRAFKPDNPEIRLTLTPGK